MAVSNGEYVIEDLSLLNTIAGRLDERIAELNNVKTQTISALESLKGNIKTTGLGDTLTRLEEAVDSKTTAVNSIFELATNTITKLNAEFSLINRDYSSGLENVNTTINNGVSN